jgi:hypothetical protein
MAEQGGIGAKLKISISTVLTLVTAMREVKFPKQKKELADVTAHDAPNGYREFADSGVRELTEFTVKLRWDKLAATHGAVMTAFNGTVPVNMSIEDRLGQEVLAFAAHVAEIGRMSDIGDQYACEVTFRPTGAPTITP